MAATTKKAWREGGKEGGEGGRKGGVRVSGGGGDRVRPRGAEVRKRVRTSERGALTKGNSYHTKGGECMYACVCV